MQLARALINLGASLTSNFTPGIGGGAGAFRVLGDYETMAIRNSYPQPQCGGQLGTFLPVWTLSNTGDAGIDASVFNQAIQTTEVSVP